MNFGYEGRLLLPVQLSLPADFHAAQLLQLVAVERATPLEVAALLRAGQGAGFPALNPVLIERLEKVGKFWPPISFTPEAKAR